MKNAIRYFRERAGMTKFMLAEKIGVSDDSIRRWEKEIREPRASDIKKLCEVLGVTEAELLNGPTEKGIDVRILIRESDEEVGKVTMDLSKDAAFLQLVEIGPHKTGLNIVFGPEMTLREVCEEILAKEDKFESARAAVYGA